MAETTSFKINCPHCNRTLNATEKVFGKTVRCPGCNGAITVPREPPSRPSARQAEVQGPAILPSQATQPPARKPTRSSAPPMPSRKPPVPQADTDLGFGNDLGEGVPASPVKQRFAPVPKSKTGFATLTLIAGAVTCVLGIYVGLWVIGAWHGIAQALANEGIVLNPQPFYLAMVVSALLLVAGSVAALMPQNVGARILLGVAFTLLFLILPALQAMREQLKHGAKQSPPSAGVNIAKLIGSWESKSARLKMACRYKRDNRYAVTLTTVGAGQPGGGIEEGEWKLDGDQLKQTPTLSTIAGSEVGKESTHTIIRLDDSELIIQAKNAQFSFKRVQGS